MTGVASDLCVHAGAMQTPEVQRSPHIQRTRSRLELRLLRCCIPLPLCIYTLLPAHFLGPPGIPGAQVTHRISP